MNTSMYEPLDGMVGELIRHGLPAEYAHRAASEWADHHRDLVDELQAAGWTESHASLEASRRLGEPQALVKKTVREYQQRYWCGRWPLITFLLGPVPGLLLIWLATGLLLAGLGWIVSRIIGHTMVEAVESAAQYAIGYSLKLWLTLLSPALVMAVFCRLASRAALNRIWIWLASATMASFVGFISCKFEFKTAANPTGRLTIGYDIWFLAENISTHVFRFFSADMWQLSQLIAPLVAAAACAVYFRARATAATRLQPTIS